MGQRFRKQLYQLHKAYDKHAYKLKRCRGTLDMDVMEDTNFMVCSCGHVKTALEDSFEEEFAPFDLDHSHEFIHSVYACARRHGFGDCVVGSLKIAKLYSKYYTRRGNPRRKRKEEDYNSIYYSRHPDHKWIKVVDHGVRKRKAKALTPAVQKV